jgi:hypothetical protein
MEENNWPMFVAESVHDPVLEPVARIFKTMVADPDTTVILLTGRNEDNRKVTENWLSSNDLTGYDALIMKQTQHMTDVVQKRAALQFITSHWGRPDMVFDDRPGVVAMWQDEGVFIFNVAQSSNVT